MSRTLADRIDALLPQTQCTRCGYDGCKPYAEAVANGEADINRCPPGGPDTIDKLAEITGRPPKPLAPDCGEAESEKVAFIREDECIGCTKCIQVCPVDAIVGAAQQMHTVIADECTGCELCVPACPVDCIDMPLAEPGTGQPTWPPQTVTDTRRADRARQRWETRNARLARARDEKAARRRRKQAALSKQAGGDKKAEIAAAIERAKAKRANKAK